jgi:PadR family transcriptional regulator PadR
MPGGRCDWHPLASPKDRAEKLSGGRSPSQCPTDEHDLHHKVLPGILWCMATVDGRRSQLLRGVLDLCLLAVMGEGAAYGYEMTKRLRARGLSIVGEGSIYPLLGRLERDGFVETRRQASNGGPPRKYYSLSLEGKRALETGVEEWKATRDAIDGALDLARVEVMP